MKDIFKDKIILFIIGVLVGAIISTGAFLVYTKANNKGFNDIKMQGRQPQSVHMGQNGNGNPPEKPSEQEQTQSNNGNGQPPEIPNDNTETNNN